MDAIHIPYHEFNIWFDVCSILTLVVIIIIFSIEGMISDRQNRLYKGMLQNATVIVFTDFFHNLWMLNPATDSEILSTIYAVLTYIHIIFVLFGLVLSIMYIRTVLGQKLTKDEKFSVICYIVISAFGIIMYIITYSSSAYATLVVVSLLFLVFTLQNPSRYVDSDSRVWNANAFRNYVSGLIEKKKKFTFINFNISDLYSIENSFARQDADSMLLVITSYFKSLKDGASLFRVNSDNFALIIENSSGKDEVVDYARRALMRFGEEWNVGKQTINLFLRECILSYPADFETYEKLVVMITYALEMNSSHEKYIMTAEDIDIDQYFYEVKIDNILRRSLEEGLLEVYFQPIYSNQKRKFDSAEALLRLKDTEMGFISPDVFIPIAEKNGTIVLLDKYVFAKACQAIKNTKACEYGLEYIEINLSVVDMIQKNLPNMVSEIAEKYGVDPWAINMEVTETSSEEISEMMNVNIQKLHEMGYQFSLDDFGTGYSNISRLKQLPLKIIKIDKYIVQSAFESEVSYDVLVNMINMGKTLKVDIVAEGVETREQAEELEKLGVNHIQGYYYSPALPVDEFVKYLQEQNM